MISQGKKTIIFPSSLGDKLLIWEFDMEKVNGMPLYWLASSIGQLLYALKSPNITPLHIAEAVRMADFNLKIFINIVEGLPLSKDTAREIIGGLEKLSAKQEIVLSDQDKQLVFIPIYNFQAVLMKELPQLNLYYISPHRACQSFS